MILSKNLACAIHYSISFVNHFYTSFSKFLQQSFLYLYSISIWNLFSFSFSMSFTDCNHFSMSLSLSYWNITGYTPHIKAKYFSELGLRRNKLWIVTRQPAICQAYAQLLSCDINIRTTLLPRPGAFYNIAVRQCGLCALSASRRNTLKPNFNFICMSSTFELREFCVWSWRGLWPFELRIISPVTCATWNITNKLELFTTVVLKSCDRQTDRRKDGQTDRWASARPRIGEETK